MQKKRLFTLVGSICLILVLAALPFMAACAAPTPAPAPAPTPTPVPAPVPTPPPEPIVLKAVTFQPMTGIFNDGLKEYIRRISEASKGELIIDLVGGPEVIPMFDLPDAVRTGALDMCMVAASFYAKMLPVSAVTHLSPLSPMEEREVGFYDYLVEQNKTINIRLIGKCVQGGKFYVMTNKKVSRPQELAGQRMASFYHRFMKALGCTPITMPVSDKYTALERGLVDGMTESSDMVGTGWYEVCKYMILPGFYYCSTGVVIVNLDKFNSLPEHLQKLMLDTQKDYEPWVWDYYREVEKKNIEDDIAHGVEIIEFTGDDAKWYTDLALKVEWDYYGERDPEMVAKVKPMFKK